MEGSLKDTRIGIRNIDIREGKIRQDAGDGEKVPEKDMLPVLADKPNVYLRPFSSGQYSRFAFLARLFWYMGGGDRFRDSRLMEFVQNREERQKRPFSWTEWLRRACFNAGSVVLLIDEGELYYHPEWQRRLVDDVFEIIGQYGKEGDSARIQVVFTTSSTFMLSDMLQEDVVVLSKPDNDQGLEFDRNLQTFGQNIHMLLANRFFMASTIGEGSERLINDLFELLTASEAERKDADSFRRRVHTTVSSKFSAYAAANEGEFDSPEKIDRFIGRLIRSIGEDFYRRQLLEMFNEYQRLTSKENTGLRKLEEARKILSESKGTYDVQKVLDLLEEIKKEGSL